MNSFKSLLAALAQQDRSFESHIRERTRGGHVARRAGHLRDFILVMPGMIAQIQSWIDAPGVPPRLKKLHGFMLTYVYHPMDFLPDGREGLFGYLDDVYLVGSLYSRLYHQFDDSHRRHLPQMEHISRRLPGWLRKTERLLPDETKNITIMLDELSEGNEESFIRMMEGTAGAAKRRGIRDDSVA